MIIIPLIDSVPDPYRLMYIIPLRDSVPDPYRGDTVPAEGRTVPPNQYWLARIRDGDVEEKVLRKKTAKKK